MQAAPARTPYPTLYSQLDTQAVIARGWLVAKIAVPATRTPSTSVSATILVIMSPLAIEELPNRAFNIDVVRGGN